MSSYTVAPLAKSDLAAIFRYVASESFSAAQRLLERFDDRFDVLAKNPQMGELRADLEENLRCVSLGNYVIFFRLGKRSIEIARVLHGARDIEAIFREGGQ